MFEVNSLLEATKYVNERHIYRNIKDDLYVPYNGYVCFNPDNVALDKIYYTGFRDGLQIKTVAPVYDLLNHIQYNFAGITDASDFLGINRHIIRNYKNSIRTDYFTLKLIKSKEELFNSTIRITKNERKILPINFKDLYDAFNGDVEKFGLLAKELYKKFKIHIYDLFQTKSLEQYKTELNQIIASIQNPFKIGNPYIGNQLRTIPNSIKVE